MSGPDDRPVPMPREAFRWFTPIDTRWADNDVYGHVNNVQAYAYFDTAVNRQMIEAGLLDPASSPVIALVVETRCAYFAPLSFPDRLQVGLRVMQLGRSSVRYQLGLFREGERLCASLGEFVHVFVDRASRRPVELPAAVRERLSALS